MMTMHPVTEDRWNELVQLFECHGNPNYCWCMTWRMASSEFRQCSSKDRKHAFKQLLRDGIPAGILGYIDEDPAGWCSVAPRPTYSRLVRSRSIKKIDNKNTWSIVCFFIRPEYRQQGYSLELLRAAVLYARSRGAEVVEGYPVEPGIDEEGELNHNVSYRFMGFLSTFLKAGFHVANPEESSRTIVRYEYDR